jgi:hypothetical protein
VRISESRRKLQGLDAPVKISVEIEQMVDVVIQQVESALIRSLHKNLPLLAKQDPERFNQIVLDSLANIEAGMTEATAAQFIEAESEGGD